MSVHSSALIGTWILESYTLSGSDGSVRHPLGSDPVGIGIYTADGYVSAQLMRRERGAPDRDRRDYIAYAGRWTTREGTVSHHVRLALHDDWIDTDLVRTVTLSDDRLVLEPPSTELNGVTFRSRLTWSRSS
ncbi:lipocalin-like domain-containing protein [Rhodococcus triatomae]|nr:hypothetical protein G419_16675 [Rhodococcus triatomae BKS 15-14]